MSILKRAIDTYNFFLDIGDKFKPKGAAPAVGTLALVLAGAGLLIFQVVADIRGSAAQGDTAQATQRSQQPEAAQQQDAVQEEARLKSTSQQPDSAKPSADGAAAKPAANDKAASSDTPQESFSFKVSRAGQYSVGTLIAYDASKAAKTYYGGDLNLSRSVITISKSDTSATAKLISISTADSAQVAEPQIAKDEPAASWFTVTNQASGSTATANSFELTLDRKNDAPNGSYQLHFIASRIDAQTSTTWAYHGFVTVNITD